MLQKLIDRIIEYAEGKKHDRLLEQYGGTQQCPYCLQTMQSGDWRGWQEHPNDPMVDIIDCGVCHGKSIWRYEIGFFYVGPYLAPEAKHDTWTYDENIHAPQLNIGEGE